MAKSFRGAAGKSLSIPRGMSEAYNRSAPLEHAAAHAAMLRDRLKQQT